MASIQKYATKSGQRWRVQYRDPAGRSRTKSGFVRKTDAQNWAAKNTIDRASGVWIAPEDQATPVGDLWAGWFASQHHLAESSRRALSSSWLTHVQPRWGAVPVGRVLPVDVQEWVDDLARRRSPSIVHRTVGVLRGLMDDAVRYRMIARTPVEGVRLPSKRAKKPTTITEGQLRALADATTRFRSLVLFLGYTGARWGEAVALTVGDIDAGRGRATINKSASTVGGVATLGETKTGQSRTIGVPGHVLEAMAGDLSGKLPGALVWTNQAGGLLTTPSRRSWFHSAVDECRAQDPEFPDISPHDLRHAAASILISHGASVMVVSRQLGHSSSKRTLDVYSHVFEDDVDHVVESVNRAVGGVVELS